MDGVVHPTSSVEVYLPWNDTWLELPPLPVLPPGHRMTESRIFSLNRGGILKLLLLGGDYNLGSGASTGGGEYTRSVWRLEWRNSNSSYYWTDELVPALGELHCSHPTTRQSLNPTHVTGYPTTPILTGHYFAPDSRVAGVPNNFLSAFHKP